ncbi:MAG: ATP-dependent metallopeptidase FtsH/Yme1/Tma family protein, partial [Rhizorhabdus sp.]
MNDDKEPKQTNPWMKSLAIWMGILLALVVFVSMFESSSRTAQGDQIPYSEFLARVDEGAVREADIGEGVVSGKFANGSTFVSNAPSDPTLIERLAKNNVTF